MLPIFSKPLDAVTADDVNAFVRERYPEGSTVEFKEQLPSKSGKDPWYQGKNKVGDYARNEIVEEVIAFANTHGGHVLIGIAETRKEPARAAKIEPVPRCAELAERLRLQIRDCVEPKIPIVHSRGIPTDKEGGGVIIIRVQQSRLAAHRHLQTLHCYHRRADRTEKMTMREIQDLTLQTERGLAAIDRAFHERMDYFRQKSLKGSEKYGLRVTLIPAVDIYASKIYQHLELFPRMRSVTLAIGSAQFELRIPRTPISERPILRGSQRTNDDNVIHVIQELHCNGLAEIRVRYDAQDSNGMIYTSWILGAVANGLLMGDAFRNGVGAPDIEYVLEMELGRVGSALLLAGLDPSYSSQPLGTVTPNPCLFPRLSIGSREEFGKIMKIVNNDLWNAAGVEGLEEDFVLSAG